MIISASYKTDLPAFYGRWFLNRLAAGYCLTTSTYHAKAVRISLAAEAVDGFVFWSKNPRPFLSALREVKRREMPFYLTFGIDGYPREIEAAVPRPEKSVELFRSLADTYGSHALVWRYDPILLTTLTDLSFHRENFARLASALAGATDEVVVAFAHMYKKTINNLTRIGAAKGYALLDSTLSERHDLIADFAAIARTHRMTLAVCAQREYLGFGMRDAQCVDAARLSRVAGRTISAKGKGHRSDCGCAPARDIGEYDTCPHGCVYCYAVRRQEVAKTRFKAHDPESEYLFAPAATAQR